MLKWNARGDSRRPPISRRSSLNPTSNRIGPIGDSKKTLQAISHAADPERQLMFAGHNAFRFASDPFYANGFVPTVAQLVARLQTGA